MIYALLVLVGMICLAMAHGIWEQDGRLVRMAVFSVVYYFMIYVLVSGILFWIDRFNLGRAAILTTVIGLVMFILSDPRKLQTELRLLVTVRKNWLPYLTILFVGICTTGSFEFYGMGQDEGVYQTKAINLMQGMTMKEQTIAEYDALPEGEYKEFYKDQIESLPGYDLTVNRDDISIVKIAEDTSEVEGTWHGIPTYPAMLALFGKIFGLKYMAELGGVFLVCALFLMQFIMTDMRVGKILQALVLLLYGLCPQIIWIRKSTLTEGFMSVLILVYLYYVLQKSVRLKVLSAIPIAVLCFYHVTVCAVLPVFVIGYWILYCMSKERGYLICTQSIALAYLLGFFMMVTVQPGYTLRNYYYSVPIISIDAMPYAAVLAVILASVCNFLLLRMLRKPVSMGKKIKRYLQGISVVSIVFVVWQLIAGQSDTQGVVHITLVGYGILSGILPMIFILGYLVTGKYTEEDRTVMLGIFFSWCILIFSMVMRRETGYYYYYGRYLVPYISVILLMFVCLIKDQTKLFGLVPVTGLLVLLPYSLVVLQNQDDSGMEWGVLENVMAEASDADIILVDTPIMLKLYFPLQASTEAEIYPVINDNIPDTLEAIGILEEDLPDVRYILAEERPWNMGWVDKTLSRQITYRQEQDDGNVIEGYLGLPESIPDREEYAVSVYSLHSKTSCITSYDDEYFVSGWSGRNRAGYRWMNAKGAMLSCYLPIADYEMGIRAGDGIPFSGLQTDSVSCELVINGHSLGTITYTAQNMGEDKVVRIPAEYVRDGYNVIQFVGDLWSPAEYGDDDESTYCLSIASIYFIELPDRK